MIPSLKCIRVVLLLSLFTGFNLLAQDATVLTTYSQDFEANVDLNLWTPNKDTLSDGTQIFAVTRENGALKVVMNQKNFFDGQMYDFATTDVVFDLTAAPMWSVKIKVEPGATYTSGGKITQVDNVVFMGSPFSVDTAAVQTRQHSNPSINVPDDGEWHELLFDWSAPDTDPQYPNVYTDITLLLLETVTWPGTFQATFWIDDFKVGDAAVPPPPIVPLMIDQTAFAPTIDGTMDKPWEDARNYQIGKLVSGTVDNWRDSYGNFRVLYDADNLYMFVRVNDNKNSLAGINDFDKDGIELYFDGDNSKNPMGADPNAWPPTAYDENDDQIRFVYKSPPTSSFGKIDVSAIQYAYLKIGTGWNLEFLMPFSNQPFQPAEGKQIGFEVQINDCDGDTVREANLKWWATNDDAWHAPAVFGTAQFTDRTINEKNIDRLVQIPYTSTPPVIDAEEDDVWKDIAPVFGNYRFLDIPLAKVDSPDDCELQWRALWDFDYLYFMVDIKDDSLVRDSGDINWWDDRISFFWDGNASLYPQYVDENDQTYGWTYNPDPNVVLDPIDITWGGLTPAQLAKFIDAHKITENGLVLEFAAPWEVLGTDVGDGAAVALDFNYEDDDDGGERDTKLSNYDPTNMSWWEPDLLGLARLTGSGIPSEIYKSNPSVLMSFELQQNYPNPFNPITTIEYTVPKSGQVQLVVYDVLGREIDKLVDRRMESGHYSIDLNASHLASGVYFYKLQCNDRTQTRKMVLVK